MGQLQDSLRYILLHHPGPLRRFWSHEHAKTMEVRRSRRAQPQDCEHYKRRGSITCVWYQRRHCLLPCAVGLDSRASSQGPRRRPIQTAYVGKLHMRVNYMFNVLSKIMTSRGSANVEGRVIANMKRHENRVICFRLEKPQPHVPI